MCVPHRKRKWRSRDCCTNSLASTTAALPRWSCRWSAPAKVAPPPASHSRPEGCWFKHQLLEQDPNLLHPHHESLCYSCSFLYRPGWCLSVLRRWPLLVIRISLYWMCGGVNMPSECACMSALDVWLILYSILSTRVRVWLLPVYHLVEFNLIIHSC